MTSPFVTSFLESCRNGEIAEALNAWFTQDERAAFAVAAIQTLDDGEVEAALLHGAPRPVFDNMRAEAKLWASWASPLELQEYLGAIWTRLPERERTSFLKAARQRVAA